MSPTISELRQLVLSCLEDVLRDRGVEAEGVDETTPLIGQGAVLDSLGLVTLIVDVEDRLMSDHGLAVTLADERAMAARRSPFRTVQTLADHIAAVHAPPTDG